MNHVLAGNHSQWLIGRLGLPHLHQVHYGFKQTNWGLVSMNFINRHGLLFGNTNEMILRHGHERKQVNHISCIYNNPDIIHISIYTYCHPFKLRYALVSPFCLGKAARAVKRLKMWPQNDPSPSFSMMWNHLKSWWAFATEQIEQSGVGTWMGHERFQKTRCGFECVCTFPSQKCGNYWSEKQQLSTTPPSLTISPNSDAIHFDPLGELCQSQGQVLASTNPSWLGSKHITGCSDAHSITYDQIYSIYTALYPLVI